MPNICLIDSMCKTRLNRSFHVTKSPLMVTNIQHSIFLHTSVLTLAQTDQVGIFIILLAFILFSIFATDSLSLRDQLSKVDMVVILFPFWVFLKLQLLVHFTNCFEEKSRPSWILSSGSVWASKESQLVNHQFILPRLRYTAEEDKTSTREFVYVAKTVSKIFKSYFRNKESCQLTARVGFCLELRVGMGP